ncbi:sulfite exporter TauE/SafE family protein [Vicingus serpentipes]|uniref:Probable membrane transporter protein n=1 Tax=Vicingus serpentipes TaxID=1926625 RepID=A0A5C6RRG1_9FLAO|nr:sulfite exporter TauE/SafE family protein [Vicingus serpentipes]TXB63982.1 sulfite exporter TauE/SafE family protein [Vicingus serpentipes]
MEIVGYILAVLIGVSSGLIGAGGSILAIPILVYFMGVEAAVTAPAYSLFVVGFSSLIGTVIKSRKQQVNFKTALFFGIPTIISIFLTRKYLVPLIPESLFFIGNFEVTNRVLILGVFSIVMIGSALIMIKGRTEMEELNVQKKNRVLNFIGGLGIGSLTGIVGAGGGFIIIPALTRLSNLKMKIAVGTSLAIIAMNSFFGFLGSINTIEIDWKVLLPFTGLAVLGIFIGQLLSSKINGNQLKKGFGWFVLIMGTYIFIKELFFN